MPTLVPSNGKTGSCSGLTRAKPCTGGSTFATTKVKETGKLHEAIEMALGEADQVVVESFISGREVTCGCIHIKDKEIILPITEVVTQNEFFDYEDVNI